LIERVTLPESQARVLFEIKGRSPHEFLRRAASRGFVPSIGVELPGSYRRFLVTA
jgi:hypothetical protein